MVTKRGLIGSSIYLYKTTYLKPGYGHWKRDVLSRWLETGTATIAASIWTLDPEHDCFDSGHCSHMLRSALFEAASPLFTDKLLPARPNQWSTAAMWQTNAWSEIQEIQIVKQCKEREIRCPSNSF